MSTNARLAYDIVAFDKSRAAIESATRNLTGFGSSIDRTLKGLNKFRTVFAAAFVGLGIRASIDAIGRSVDKNLVDKADLMQSRWKTTWDSWGNTADRLITESAMGLDGLITDASKALGLIDQVAEQSVNRSGKGGLVTPAPGADYAKGLPNNVTDISKTGAAIQGVNRALKENAIGYQAAAKAKREWTFETDILRGLDEQISLLTIQRDAFGESASAIDAMMMRQQALNEAVRAGNPLTDQQIAQLDLRIEKMRELGAQVDDLRQKEDDLKASQEEMREMTEIAKTGFADLAVAAGDGKLKIQDLRDIIESLRDRFIRLAAEKFFEFALNFFMQSPTPGGSAPNFNFGGLYADGGTLGAGKWGIAGEAGPEIIKGPASVVPLSGMGGSNVDIKIINQGGITSTQTRRESGGREMIEIVNRVVEGRFPELMMKNAPLIGGTPASKRFG